MNKIALLFPGQGSQYIGMGKDFVGNYGIALDTFNEASEVLGYDMKALCLKGPPKELLRTEKAQPAILATSVAMLKVFEKYNINCDITAGLSLGEYTALVKAGAITFKDALLLTERRGLFMEEAASFGVGGMAAIIGLSIDSVNKCLESVSEYGAVEVANHNSHYQVIISGNLLAVKKAIDKAKILGAKKALLLPVKHPFHSSLMKKAGKKLKRELIKTYIKDLEIPLVTNSEARIIKKSSDVSPSLIKQIYSTVLWYDSIKLMLHNGINIFVEIGPGDILSAFAKNIADHEGFKVTAVNIENKDSWQQTIRALADVKVI